MAHGRTAPGVEDALVPDTDYADRGMEKTDGKGRRIKLIYPTFELLLVSIFAHKKINV